MVEAKTTIPINVTQAQFPVAGVLMTMLLLISLIGSVASYFRRYVIREEVVLNTGDHVQIWLGGCQLLFSQAVKDAPSTVTISAWGEKIQDSEDFFDLNQAQLFDRELEADLQHQEDLKIASAHNWFINWILKLFRNGKHTRAKNVDKIAARLKKGIKRNPNLANPYYETWRWADSSHLYLSAMAADTEKISINDLCAIHFKLAPDFSFGSLRVKASDSRDFTHIRSEITLKASDLVEITALHANVNFIKSIEARRMKFKLRDGYLKLTLDGDPAVYDFITNNALQIDSHTAPIFIRGSIPMDITLTEQQATRLFVRAYEIETTNFVSQRDAVTSANDFGDLDEAHRVGEIQYLKLTAHTKEHVNTGWFHRNSASFSIKLPYKSQSPLYIELRDLDPVTKEPVIRSVDQGWAGVEHIDQPHLLSYSASLVQDIKYWVRSDSSAPWMLNVIPVSSSLDPNSFWRIVSSDAYVSGTVSWFTVLSAGLLRPRFRRSQLHVLGSHCRGRQHKLSLDNLNAFRTSFGVYTDLDTADDDLYLIAERYKKMWPSVYPGDHIGLIPEGSSCVVDKVNQIYVVIWKALSQVASYSTMVLWIQGNATPIKFRLSSDVVMRELVSFSDTWLFNVAAAVNMIVSVTCGVLLVSRYFRKFITHLKKTQDVVTAEHNASHRLVHTVTDYDGGADDDSDKWVINVAEITHPGHGLSVKWNEAYSPLTARLALYIQRADATIVPHNRAKRTISKKSEDEETLMSEVGDGVSGVLAVHDEHGRDQAGALVVVYFTLGGVSETVLFGITQFQIIIPVKNPGGEFTPQCSQAYSLHARTLYKLRLAYLNSDGRELSSSKWSEECLLNLKPTCYMVPDNLLLSRQQMINSLELFVERHLVRQVPHRVLVLLNELELRIEDPLGVGSRAGRLNQAGSMGAAAPPLKLKLVLFAGEFSQRELRKWQTLNWNIDAYTETTVTGVPTYDEATSEYVLDLGDLEMAVALQFVGKSQCTWVIFDAVTDHLLARGTLDDAQWGRCAAAEYDPKLPHPAICEWNIRWNPRCALTLLQGRDSTKKWGTLTSRGHPLTARWYCQHPFGAPSDSNSQEGVFFVGDVPGLAYPEGSEVVIRWVWPTPPMGGDKPWQVTVHVRDFKTSEVLRVLENIPNTGSLCWGLSIPFAANRKNRQIFFSIHCKGREVARSNGWNVTRVFSITEFEFAYSSFCRTFNYEMQHVSEASLRALGLDITTSPLKICPDLRHPLPFEKTNKPYFHCPGQFIVSTQSIVGRSGSGGGVHVYKSITRTVTWIENHYLSSDLDVWLCRDDVKLNQHHILPISLYKGLRKILMQARWPQKGPPSLYYGRQADYRSIEPSPQDVSAPWALLAKSPHIVSPATFEPILSANFAVKRIMIFYLPSVLNVVYKFLLLTYYAWYSFLTLLLYIQYNQSTLETSSVHFVPDTKFIYDIFFSDLNPLVFLVSLPHPGPELIIFNIVWITAIFASVYLEPYNTNPAVGALVKKIGLSFQYLQLFTAVSVVISFILWFAVGALINSSRFLPYAVFLGSTLFVTYTLWCNYRQAADLVMHYIEENQQTLLSICFDRWFDAEHLDPEEILQREEDDTQDAHASGISKRLFQLQIGAWRRKKLRQLTDVLVRKDNAAGPLDNTGITNSSSVDSWNFESHFTHDAAGSANDQRGCLQTLLAARIRKEVCTWELRRVVANVSKGESFYLDHNGALHGLDNLQLPKHTHLACLKDFRRTVLEELLIGFDSALLQDGIIYGPRLQFKTETTICPGQRYAVCIVMIPVWPEADVLEPFMKVCLIMDFFDEASNGLWSLNELNSWNNKCGGTDQRYQDFVSCFGQNSVVKPEDLERFYTNNPERLDLDYSTLYCSEEVETANAEEPESPAAEADEELLSPSRIDDWEDEDDNWSDEEFDDVDEDDADDGTTTMAKVSSTTPAPGTATLNLNSLRLRYIYKSMTEKNRNQDVINLSRSIPFISQNVVDLHFAILSPIFGRVFQLSDDRRSNHAHRTNSDSGRFLSIMKNQHCDILRDFRIRTAECHARLFERSHVQRVIGKYYDSDMVENIQLKASRLTDIRIELSPQDLDVTNQWIISYATVTAKQAMRSYSIYRSRSILELREKLQVANHFNKIDLKVSLMTETLLEIGVLRESEVESGAHLHSPATPGTKPTTPVSSSTLYRPVSSECGKFLGNLVHDVVGSNPMTVDSVTEILERIFNEYLWLFEFRALLALCGIPFREALLPGRVFDDSETSMIPDDVISDVLSVTQIGNENELIKESIKNPDKFRDQNLIEVKNICIMKQIFDKFSNASNFLPVDLADEAILLLTDNKLPTSGILSCLMKLDLGDLSYMKRSSVQQCLSEIEETGVEHDSGAGAGGDAVIIEDWNGDDKLGLLGDVKNMLEQKASQNLISRQAHGYESMLLPTDLDWAKYRITDTWPRALKEAYKTLTSSSPGFVTKNQLAELVQKVQSFFISDIKLISFHTFHNIMMELALAVSKRHSRLIWILINLDVSSMLKGGGVASVDEIFVSEILPLELVSHSVTRVILQPCDSENQVLTLARIMTLQGASSATMSRAGETPLDLIAGYSGYFCFAIFMRFVAAIGVDIAPPYVKNVWLDIVKDPFMVGAFTQTGVKSSTGTQRSYVKVNMDPNGLDPYVGFYSEIDRVRHLLPRLLCKGLWPSALRHLLRLNMNLMKGNEENAVMVKPHLLDRYGLVRPKNLSEIIELSASDSAGMNFQMLAALISKMDLELPPGESCKKLFDSLDINRDGTLDMNELLSGFEILLSRLLPIKIFENVGLTLQHFWLKILAVFMVMSVIFLFTGLAFTSFVGGESAADTSTGGAGSTTVQSILALLGAVGLQSGASQDSEKVIAEMKIKMESVLFPNSKKSTVHLEDQILKNRRIHNVIYFKKKYKKLCKVQNQKFQPVSLIYEIPKNSQPQVREPRSAVKIMIGETLKLDPVVVLKSGVSVRNVGSRGVVMRNAEEVHTLIQNGLTVISSADASLIWSIRPAFPPGCGLVFDHFTGVIRTEWRKQGKNTPLARRCYTVVARNQGGKCRARLSLQTLHSL